MMERESLYGLSRATVLCAFAALVFAACALLAATAPGAARADDGLEAWRYTTNKQVAGRDFSISATSKVTGAKSSDKKVMTVKVVKQQGEPGASQDRWDIKIAFKNPGSATLTYKAEGEKRSIKFKAYKYVNPVKSFKVGSVEFAKKFKKSFVFETNDLLKGKLKVKAAKNWRVDYISVMGDLGSKTAKIVKSGYKLPSRKVCGICVALVNTKTGVSDTLWLDSISSDMTQKARSVAGLAVAG